MLRRASDAIIAIRAWMLSETRRWPFQIICAVVVLYWVALALQLWTYEIPIPTEQVQAESGFAATASLRRFSPALPPLAVFRGDDSDAPQTSRLQLLEDGKRLGPAHSLHDAIRKEGRGRYSHWGQDLYFSASDNTSPLNNGRIYRVIIPASPSTLLDMLALAASIVLIRLFLAFVASRPNTRPARILFGVQTQPIEKPMLTVLSRASNALIATPPLRWERLLTCVLFVATVSFAWWSIYDNWIHARTISSAFAGFIPFSDAAGYFTCANNLIDFGEFVPRSAQWCSRRPVYMSFLAPLMALTSRELHVLLPFQATIAALAISILSREMLRLAGIAGAVLASILLSIFAMQNVYPNILTENAGLIYGCTAIALLLRGAETGRWWLLYAGIALLSVAINARAGCFFVLPMLVLWCGYEAYRENKRSALSSLTFAVLAVAFGFGVQFALIAANGQPLAASQGNFAHVLYGLAFGAQGWGVTEVDHPGATSQELYRFAFAEIARNPTVIVGALFKAFFINLTNGNGLFGGFPARLGDWVLTLWVVGFVVLALNWRNRRYGLVGAITLGGLLSGPLIVIDGGPRVYAATIGMDTAQAAIGLGLVLGGVSTFLGMIAEKTRQEHALSFASLRASARKWLKTVMQGHAGGHNARVVPFSRLTVAVSMGLTLLLALPYLGVLRAAASEFISTDACPTGQLTHISKLSAESTMLTVTGDDRRPSVLPAIVSLGMLRQGAVGTVAENAIDRPIPYTTILAYQRRREAPNMGQLFGLYAHGDLSNLRGKWVRFCYSSDNAYKDYVFGTTYVVESIEVLAPRN